MIYNVKRKILDLTIVQRVVIDTKPQMRLTVSKHIHGRFSGRKKCSWKMEIEFYYVRKKKS